MSTHEEPIVQRETKTSARLRNQPMVQKLQEAIENLSISHKSILNELKGKSSEISYDRLEKLKHELAQGIANVTQLHDQLKQAESDLDHNTGVVKDIDRITADYRYVAEEIENRKSQLSVKPRHNITANAADQKSVYSNASKKITLI